MKIKDLDEFKEALKEFEETFVTWNIEDELKKMAKDEPIYDYDDYGDEITKKDLARTGRSKDDLLDDTIESVVDPQEDVTNIVMQSLLEFYKSLKLFVVQNPSLPNRSEVKKIEEIYKRYKDFVDKNYEFDRNTEFYGWFKDRKYRYFPKNYNIPVHEFMEITLSVKEIIELSKKLMVTPKRKRLPFIYSP